MLSRLLAEGEELNSCCQQEGSVSCFPGPSCAGWWGIWLHGGYIWLELVSVPSPGSISVGENIFGSFLISFPSGLTVGIGAAFGLSVTADPQSCMSFCQASVDLCLFALLPYGSFSSGRYLKSIGSLTSWSEGLRNCIFTVMGSVMSLRNGGVLNTIATWR